MSLSNIGLIPIIIVGGLAGALSTVYIVVSLFWTIIYKIYRKVKFKEAIF